MQYKRHLCRGGCGGGGVSGCQLVRARKQGSAAQKGEIIMLILALFIFKPAASFCLSNAAGMTAAANRARCGSPHPTPPAPPNLSPPVRPPAVNFPACVIS